MLQRLVGAFKALNKFLMFYIRQQQNLGPKLSLLYKLGWYYLNIQEKFRQTI